MEGIRGVSYHHLTSSASATATGASSKYRLPSQYPSSSCPGSNNSSISSPYSPSSQYNSHQSHISNNANHGRIPSTATSSNTEETTLRSTPTSVAIDVSTITTRPPSCSPVDLTSSSSQITPSESSSKMDIMSSAPLLNSTTSAKNGGGPLTRSRKRKMGGDSDQSTNIHLNMPTIKNTSVTITLQVNSAASPTSSSSTSNNEDEIDTNSSIFNDTAQIVPTNRATAPKLQKRGYFEDMPISRLGINQQSNHPALALMSSNLSAQSFCGSEVINPPTTTTTHASLAVLAATDASDGSNEHIHNIRSAFASIPTSITSAAATTVGSGAVGLGCRGNAAVTITLD